MFVLKAVGYNQYILFIIYCPPNSFDFSDLTKYAKNSTAYRMSIRSNVRVNMVWHFTA